MNSAMGAIVDARPGAAYLGYLESRLNSGFPPPFVVALVLLWVNGRLLCLFSRLWCGRLWLGGVGAWLCAGRARVPSGATARFLWSSTM